MLNAGLHGFCTEDVDINGGSGASAGIDSLNDVCGGVASGGFADGQLGVSQPRVYANAVISLEDQISLCPLHPRIRLSFDIGGKLDLGAGPGGQTSQQLDVQLDLRRLC